MSGLVGELVRLRARHESDVAVLTTELYDDVENTARAARNPWRPISPAADAGPFRVPDRVEPPRFSVVELASDELAGSAMLWGVDRHNRVAHLGLGLRPAFRGKGLGTDIVRVLCHYGFAVLGLHRLQVDTLSDNHGMIRAAERAGFVHEGVVREAAWIGGGFGDEVALGLLAQEWAG
ncbi:MAG TPA: GNAT family protein [Pseudonocardiaceae bacterium]|jgi:RimJ/RimL family protein N-acetyltransferase|nr:GNAT family protein [Pseudonocardiaceae bacterium]